MFFLRVRLIFSRVKVKMYIKIFKGVYILKNKLRKPSELIAITHYNITTIMRKSYNVLLQNALIELEKNINNNIFAISISKLKNKAGIGATDNKRLKEELFKLQDLKVEYNIFNKVTGDYTDWTRFSLIPVIRKKDDILEYQLPFPVCEILKNPKIYTMLDLVLLKDFKKKYSIILYEIIKDYEAVEVPKMSISELRDLLGISKTKYPNFYDFKKNVIDTAVEEINKKNKDFLIDYSLSKTGRKTTHIKFKKLTGIEIAKRASKLFESNLKGVEQR